MQAWELGALEAAGAAAGRLYHEFLSVPDLSGGLYVLDAGAVDPQVPHGEDELYVVVAGRGAITVGADDRRVGPGSVVFFGSHVPPHFRGTTAHLATPVASSP